MQLANCIVSLAGDSGNTVPKFGVTVAEIAVLRVIHGDDAVNDIEPAGETAASHTHRREIARLTSVYGVHKDGRVQAQAVSMLFPGAAARVFETLDELQLPDSAFKATGRMQTSDRKVAEDVVEWEVPVAVKAADAPVASTAPTPVVPPVKAKPLTAAQKKAADKAAAAAEKQAKADERAAAKAAANNPPAPAAAKADDTEEDEEINDEHSVLG